MADAPAAESSKSAFGFMGKKVFGKIPVWVIAVAVVAGYEAWTRFGPGKKAAAAQQTDPAGNTCAQFNPATGFCPGSAEDQSAIQAQQTQQTDPAGNQCATLNPSTGIYPRTLEAQQALASAAW